MTTWPALSAVVASDANWLPMATNPSYTLWYVAPPGAALDWATTAATSPATAVVPDAPKANSVWKFRSLCG